MKKKYNMILSSALLFILLLNTESKRLERGCEFPQEWEGIWFQSTVRPYIKVDRYSISSKGKCTESDRRGEKYIIQEKRNCYKCIVIHQKHLNVLQYKETLRCSKQADLHRVCRDIAGDANLYTLFRVDGQPIECPFGTRHGFTFSYNRGKGDCQWPESELEPCTDTKRLVLNYQACPNVQGSELRTEKLECQASWKDGSRHFMVGKLDHLHASTDEDKFRCFVYEYMDPLNPTDGLFLAQSGDATCNGLFSPHEGSRTLKLTRAPSKINCQFPSWMQKSWSTLDGDVIWRFDDPTNSTWIKMHTVTSDRFGASSYVERKETQIWCHQVIQSQEGVAKIILYTTEQCSSGFVCADLKLNAPGVMRVQLGSLTRTLEYACDASQFIGAKTHLLISGGTTSSTQIGETSKEKALPNGLFHIKGDPRILLENHQGQQLSAAVRADLLDLPNGAGVVVQNEFHSKEVQLCQDGSTPKIFSVILGCSSSHQHSDLELRSTCKEDHVNLHKEYKNTHLWSENGTDFRLYKKMDSSTSGICLGFGTKNQQEFTVIKLDKNCENMVETRIQKRQVEPLGLIFQGDCSSVSSKATTKEEMSAMFGFHQKDKLFMILSISVYSILYQQNLW